MNKLHSTLPATIADAIYTKVWLFLTEILLRSWKALKSLCKALYESWNLAGITENVGECSATCLASQDLPLYFTTTWQNFCIIHS